MKAIIEYQTEKELNYIISLLKQDNHRMMRKKNATLDFSTGNELSYLKINTLWLNIFNSIMYRDFTNEKHNSKENRIFSYPNNKI